MNKGRNVKLIKNADHRVILENKKEKLRSLLLGGFVSLLNVIYAHD